MLAAVANLSWVLVLGIFVVVYVIGWVYRLRHTTTRRQHNGPQNPPFDPLADQSFQPEDEFEDAEDVIMVSDDDDDSELEIRTLRRQSPAQTTPQRETSIPTHTVQVNRKH